jgi:hypothetical protein
MKIGKKQQKTAFLRAVFPLFLGGPDGDRNRGA